MVKFGGFFCGKKNGFFLEKVFNLEKNLLYWLKFISFLYFFLMNSQQIESILIEIKKSEQNILKKVKQFSNQTFVIILGITGDGKSSLSNCLLRKDVIISKGAGNKVLLTGAGIKSGFQSCTKEPLITHDEITNLVYCDCPGFDDNNGYNQEIINSFMINYLFDIKSNNKFKILLVISSSQIEASRGSNVISTIQRMINMFPKPEQLNKGMGIVITKGESELNGIDYLEQLIDNSAPLVQNWCQYFISNPDCVFTFPMALRIKIGQKYEFDDNQRLIEFLKINPISNIIHKLTISEQATLYIKNMQLKLIEVFKDNLE